MTYTVVITGGIASGKTAVSDRFERLGIEVIDTDRISREVVEPGQPALQEIGEKFGLDYLDSAGRLDRQKMRALVFSDANARQNLESILHPAIRQQVKRRVNESSAPYCVIVIPLFAESGAYDWIDRVLVVDVGEETQIARVMARDHVTREQAQSILAAQASRDQRLALADDVILNDGSLQSLDDRVLQLHQHYLTLAN